MNAIPEPKPATSLDDVVMTLQQIPVNWLLSQMESAPDTVARLWPTMTEERRTEVAGRLRLAWAAIEAALPADEPKPKGWLQRLVGGAA